MHNLDFQGFIVLTNESLHIKKRTFVYQIKVRFFRLLGTFSGENQQIIGKMRVGAVVKTAPALIFLPAEAKIACT